ncbi:MAG: polyprenyl synthetase family protein [Candidatus Helarchaeota archaeon]
MKVPEYLNLYKSKINNAIKLIFEKKINSITNSFLKDYYSELLDYFLSGGKRLRPLICIASYNAFKSKNDEKIIYPSVGVEFLHNASLIHDDIIDRDDFRRGKPAFHYRFKQYHQKHKLSRIEKDHFGSSLGIIGGDTAYFFGLEAFFNNKFDNSKNNKAIEYYKEAFKNLCDGILIELAMIDDDSLKIDDYIKMISLKTGALIQKSMLIGASYADCNLKNISYLGDYGLNLGIIFQIVDDILGTFGDEKVTGKPTDGDIREGKKTCLLIEAIQRLDENKRSRLLNLVGNNNITQEEVEEVKDLFKDANVINESKKIADKYTQLAKMQLEKLKPEIDHSELEFFENLLKYVLERKF